MRKIKISEAALATNLLLPFTVNRFKAIKLTREQALNYSFVDERSSYGVLRAKYAQEELKEGEPYEGYVLFNNGISNCIAYISGYFRKETPEEHSKYPLLSSVPRDVIITTYRGVYRTEKGKETLGELKSVLTLGTLAFEKYLLQEEAEGLRQKIIKSVLENNSVEITKSEDNALRQILGNRYKSIVKNVNVQRKKLRIIKENLVTHDIDPGYCTKMVAIKRSEKQAMRFNLEDEASEVDTLISKYGQENVLNENEHYKGYALLYNDYCGQIITMDGHIASSVDELGQKVYKICCIAEDGKSDGYAKHIFTFGNFRFDMYCNEDLAERTRSKIVEAVISGEETEFAEDEMALLIMTFGYFHFFEITEEIEEVD